VLKRIFDQTDNVITVKSEQAVQVVLMLTHKAKLVCHPESFAKAQDKLSEGSIF
jgi:hypothetical protein